MPSRFPHACAEPGCSALVLGRRCPAHAAAKEHQRRNYDIRREYRKPQWKALRREILRDVAYTCHECQRISLELEIDHVVKHDGDPGRFWDRVNLQALCRTCHQRKTARGE